MTLSDEQIAEWCNDAERDVLTTRAPSGYYPTARILRLIMDRQRLIAERDQARAGLADAERDGFGNGVAWADERARQWERIARGLRRLLNDARDVSEVCAQAREAALRERIQSLADAWEGVAGRTSDRGRRIAYRTCAYLLHGLLGEAGEQ